MFNKIEKGSVHDLVFEQLKKSILDGTFQPGDRLPSENELCAQLGVSRPSVKMAIQRLCTLSIVETCPGDGSYVTKFSPAAFFGQVADFVVNRDNIGEMAEYRMHMEIVCAELAIERATEEDLGKLDQILDAMEAARKVRNIDEHCRLDYLFHLTIARATKNHFLLSMYEMMESLSVQYIVLENASLFESLDEATFFDVHRGIADAIRRKDLQRCIALYSEKYDL